MTHIVAISDTHLETPDLPEGDLLLHTGDFTFMGLRAKTKEALLNYNWLQNESKKFKKMLGVAGNHDWDFHKDTFHPYMDLLFDEEVEFEGLRIYGTPYVPQFYDWAFMMSEEDLYNHVYSQIPEGLDILLTHGPAYGILDINKHGNQCGSTALKQRLEEMKHPPRFLIHGHIHIHNDNMPQYIRVGKTTHINASYNDEHYNPTNKIIQFSIGV